MLSHWQVQDAKQRFSELLRSVRSNGPQFMTRHGRPVAVVLDIDEYRQLKGDAPDFKTFLRAAPNLESWRWNVRATPPARLIWTDSRLWRDVHIVASDPSDLWMICFRGSYLSTV